MYKILTTIEQINLINEAQSQKEEGSIYCEINKSSNAEEYAIPIIKTVLNGYGLEFIDEEWLNANTVETLPLDWDWTAINKSMRFIISNKDIVDGTIEQNGLNVVFQNLAQDALSDLEIEIDVDDLQTIFYANQISEENIYISTYIKTITDENGFVIYSNENGIIDVEYKRIL